ncbi:MAG: hypothetical protein JSW71_00375 [Gemmatimonadota bacterium]|nr:MAG: hypothetical protein JSW71_00375 [Gemmatimonadota bacterium]
MSDLRPMFSCLFCQAYLGHNDLIEHCPVGRRLAFDQRQGRLWVVCQACGSWNLTPLDERWEAIEECERQFRATSVRVCTENIGLAVVYERLDLIRIGTPFRQELAVWRYADELRGRRRRALFKAGARVADDYGWMIGAGGLVGAGVALLVGAPAAIGLGMMAGAGTEEIFREVGPERIERLLGRIIAKVRINTLDYSFVRTGHVPELRVVRTDFGWRLEMPHSVGWEGYEGAQATHVLGLMLPLANGFGATRTQVMDAVSDLETVGDAEEYMRMAAQRLDLEGMRKKGLRQYPIPMRLALEMAAHEETERHALRGQLKWLERRWRDAEEIAEIADNLFTTSADELRTATLVAQGD